MDSVTEFESGAIRDNQDGKEDYVETISWIAMKRFAIYMTDKKAKYGVGNFKKGIPIESYERSMMRHVQKYLSNTHENANVEPDEDHLAAIVFNVCGIMHEEARQINKGLGYDQPTAHRPQIEIVMADRPD